MQSLPATVVENNVNRPYIQNNNSKYRPAAGASHCCHQCSGGGGCHIYLKKKQKKKQKLGLGFRFPLALAMRVFHIPTWCNKLPFYSDSFLLSLQVCDIQVGRFDAIQQLHFLFYCQRTSFQNKNLFIVQARKPLS